MTANSEPHSTFFRCLAQGKTEFSGTAKNRTNSVSWVRKRESFRNREGYVRKESGSSAHICCAKHMVGFSYPLPIASTDPRVHLRFITPLLSSNCLFQIPFKRQKEKFILFNVID